MFAVIKTGGKQYKVAENDIIKVEKLAGASNDVVEFDEVLMLGTGDKVSIGAPVVTKAKVCGTILEQTTGDKVIVFKKKRRHNYRRKRGHRQLLTVVRITDILPEGGAPKKASAQPKAEKEAAPKTDSKAETSKTTSAKAKTSAKKE